MGIIDEKGRLFGRINIIDFLAVLVLVCIIPAFYFGYGLVTMKVNIEDIPKEFIEIETECLLIKLKPELINTSSLGINTISVGAKERGEQRQVIGEIINLGRSEPYKYHLDIGTGQKIIKEDNALRQVRAKVRLRAKVIGDSLFYKDNIVKIDYPFEFIIGQHKLTGIFIKEEEKIFSQEQTVSALLTIQCINLVPEVAQVVRIDDKNTIAVGEGMKRVISRISAIVSNKPSAVITLADNKQDWVTTSHPYNRDLVLQIETLCVNTPEGLFLERNPIKIGRTFEFSTELYSVSGTIIDLRLQ